MALVHNMILRGFNSIYLQATHIPEVEKAAFVGYSQAWYRTVTDHHEAEEEDFFPKVAELLKDEHLFDEAVDEHRKQDIMPFIPISHASSDR
jgi:hemerythrin superfamily protein